MEKLRKNEERKLRDEIEYWSKHQELDKFNYDMTTSSFLSAVSIIIAIFIFIVSFSFLNEQYKLATDSTIVIIIILIILTIYTFWKRNNHNKSFMIREDMIEERYEKLGVNKKRLNDEFEDKKKII